MTEWFEEWFGEEYLQLYPHRDAAEAERAVALILERTGFVPGWRVLDVACGAGRHARAPGAPGLHGPHSQSVHQLRLLRPRRGARRRAPRDGRHAAAARMV